MALQEFVEALLFFCARYVLLRPIAAFIRRLSPLLIAHDRTSRIVEKLSRDPGFPVESPTSAAWQIPAHPQLSEVQSTNLPERADVLIIGSGITAASTAYHLLASDPDIKVVIAEARTLTSGATGRNGGHILELPYEDYDLEVSMLGTEAARKLFQFRLDHLDEILEFVRTKLSEEAAKASEIRVVDVVDAILDSELWGETKAQLARFLEAFPEHVDKWKVWEGDEAHKRFGMPRIAGAVGGRAGAIWPYRFVTSVYEKLTQEFPDRFGIETNTPVGEIRTAGSESESPYLVATPRGEIQTKNIVHATNGHVAHLLPRLRGKIFPLRGQMTVQSLDGEDAPANLGSQRSWMIRHSKGYDYMTQNPATGDYFLGGGTLQAGLEDIGNSGDDEQSFLALCHLKGVLPGLFGAGPGQSMQSSTMKSFWTGVLGFSCDGRPWVGKLPSAISQRNPQFMKGTSGGEYIAAAFCGSGMVYCWKSGQAVASMILGKDIGWLPESLLPSEQRYRSCDVRDGAAHWLDVSLR